MKCPPLNELADYTRGFAPIAERPAIEAHLAEGCGDCGENLRWLGEITLLAARDRSFDFPEETIKGIVAWFKSQPAHSSQTILRSVPKLIANLIFDSLTPRQFAPVRGDDVSGHPIPPAADRQMLFQTEGYDIDLRFEGIEDKATENLIGQILPQNEAQPVAAGVTVRLCPSEPDEPNEKDERDEMNTQADDRGLFQFTQISSGLYDLKIRVAEGEINLYRVSTARA